MSSIAYVGEIVKPVADDRQIAFPKKFKTHQWRAIYKDRIRQASILKLDDTNVGTNLHLNCDSEMEWLISNDNLDNCNIALNL
jgi:hypothetical protein